MLLCKHVMQHAQRDGKNQRRSDAVCGAFGGGGWVGGSFDNPGGGGHQVAVDAQISRGIVLEDGLFDRLKGEAVVMDLGQFRGPATDADGGLFGQQERVVVDEDPQTGHVGAVLAVDSPVHVEGVAVGIGTNDVVAGLVGGAGKARAGNGVAAPVEAVVFDERAGLVDQDIVAQPLALAVMNMVVVDVRACSGRFEPHR